MDITIKELIVTQETYEKNQARFKVTSSTKYRINNVVKSAETFISNDILQEMLKEVIQSAVRAVTVQFDVVEARAKKTEMAKAVKEEIQDDLAKWGLSLESFQLVDFQDTETSKIISNISKRREIEIESTTREQNAEKTKQAQIKEAEADEAAKSREIKRDETVAMKEQNKKQQVAEQEKLAREKEYEVKKVEAIKQAEIDKEEAKILAEKERAVEEINKEQKRLSGEGDRLRDEEIAKGLAAPIREKGFAEAEAKEKLQEALNKFDDNAIRALVAEKVVEKDQVVGIATANALREADMKVFAGGDNGGGFDLGKLIAATKVADNTTAGAILNNTARPNDLGISPLGLLGIAGELPKEKPEQKPKPVLKGVLHPVLKEALHPNTIKERAIMSEMRNDTTIAKLLKDGRELNLGLLLGDLTGITVKDAVKKVKEHLKRK